MTPHAGEFWLAAIPYTSGEAAKLRPVLVLWEDAVDVVVAAVTKATPRSATDVALQDWAEAGLVVPSTVRLSRLDCLEQVLLRRRLGVVSAEDARRLRACWSERVRPGF